MEIVIKRSIPNHVKQKRKESKYPNNYFKKKDCRFCGENFQPIAPSHHYCSDDCAAKGIAQRHLKNSYNLTYKEWEEMYENQNHVCAICSSEGFKMNEKVYSGLNVDHCHETGVVRGLLCHNCNRGLGLFKDNIENLKQAILYLEGATTIPKGSTLK